MTGYSTTALLQLITSHSTQNLRSSQPVFWLVLKKLNQTQVKPSMLTQDRKYKLNLYTNTQKYLSKPNYTT